MSAAAHFSVWSAKGWLQSYPRWILPRRKPTAPTSSISGTGKKPNLIGSLPIEWRDFAFFAGWIFAAIGAFELRNQIDPDDCLTWFAVTALALAPLAFARGWDLG